MNAHMSRTRSNPEQNAMVGAKYTMAHLVIAASCHSVIHTSGENLKIIVTLNRKNGTL